MHATKKREELRAVLGNSFSGKLNLAAEISAADSECAGRSGENRKAIRTTKEMMRTKRESPDVAIGQPNATNLVAVGSEPC